MAATEKGVWDVQEVRDKQLASEWLYDGLDPGKLFGWGNNTSGQLGLNDNVRRSSPTQVGTDTTSVSYTHLTLPTKA